MQAFSDKLKEAIEKGLPGSAAHLKMSPSARLMKGFPEEPGESTKIAAVLILLYPYKGSIYTVLMQRPEYPGFHGGQISFPGGKQERGDSDMIMTAIREAHEETGIDSSVVEVIGILTPLFIPISNMLVTPVIGWCNLRPDFQHDPVEVSFLIEANISELLKPSAIKTRLMELRGQTTEIKYFGYDGHVIWGATAMILNELLEIINNLKAFPAR